MTTIGSLCSGIGGLELGVERALGARTVWQAEIDPHASVVLAHRWLGVPNIGDVRDLAAMTPVDILTAGYPCQPFSTAGRRKGTDDPRHLWPAVHAAIAHLGPRLVVLENVRGHLTLGFDRVLGDLADIGYDAEWRVVRASDVGCCHQRARLFVAAYPSGIPGPPEQGGSPSQWATEPREHHCTRDPRDADKPTDFGEFETAVRIQEAWHGPAPTPALDGHVNPAFVEWMMGYPSGWVIDILTDRDEALRCLGNAVVPQVAEAFCLGLLGEDALSPVDGELLPTPTASYGEGGKHARNLTWDGNTAYRPSGAKASVSLLEALDRTNLDGAA